MKINKIKILCLNVPLKKPYRSLAQNKEAMSGQIKNIFTKKSVGFITSRREVLLIIECDNGVNGFGEVVEEPLYGGENIDQICQSLLNYKSFLLGEDPLNIKKIIHKIEKTKNTSNYALAAITTALMDITGKHMEMPIYNVLGGKVRNYVYVDYVIPIDEPEKCAQEAVNALKNGFTNIVQKIGLNPENDVETIKQIRENVGWKIKLAVDANQGYSKQTAINTIKKFERYEIEYFEQPIHASDIEGLSLITKKSSILIAADESLKTIKNAKKLIEKKAANMFVIEYAKNGGIHNSIKIAELAESEGIPCRHGGSWQLGVGVGLAAHLVYAIKNFTIPFNDLNGPLAVKNDIIKSGLVYKKNKLELSKKPGLGIELNEKIVDEYKYKDIL